MMETKVKSCYDYCGNEIKEGMEILLISTKSLEITIGGKYPKGAKSMFVQFPAEDEWRVIMEYKVTTNDMFSGLLLARTKTGDVYVENSLCYLIDNLKENQIITIKGVSDQPKNK